MAVIQFPFETRRRPRPARPGNPRGEIVIFTGVRIDRQPPVEMRADPDPLQRRPSPGKPH